MKLKELTPIWRNQTAFLAGGGMSMHSYDLDSLRGHNVIAVNNCYQILPFAQFLIFMDSDWEKRHHERLKFFQGTIVHVARTGQFSPLADLKIERATKHGLSTNPLFINPGSNSGYCALNLAVLLGVTRIVLLGFDMRPINGSVNYHKDHARYSTRQALIDFIKTFSLAAETLDKMKISLVNATPNSALTSFPMTTLEAELQLVQGLNQERKESNG